MCVPKINNLREKWQKLEMSPIPPLKKLNHFPNILFNYYIQSHSNAIKTKVSHLQAMKVHGGRGCKGQHIAYTAMALGRTSVTSPTLGLLYPRQALLILQEAEWSQDQSGHEGVQKNLHLSDVTPGIEPGPFSPQPSALPFQLPGPYSNARFIQIPCQDVKFFLMLVLKSII